MKFYRLILSIITLVSCFLLVYSQHALAQQDQAVKVQDLEEIYDTAFVFINQDNQQKQTSWKVLEPNQKTVVARCQVPLTAKWGVVFMDRAKRHISVKRYPIFVTCKKDATNTTWTVHVPTTRPDNVVVHK